MDQPIQRRILDATDERTVALRLRDEQRLMTRELSGFMGMPQEEPDDFKILAQYFWILWKHRWMLALFMVLGGLVGLGVSLWRVPVYQARASLEIQNVQEPFNTPMVTSNPAVATQAQLLASAALRERARARVEMKPDNREPKVSGILASLRQLLRLPDPAKSIDWARAAAMAAGSLTVTTPKEGNIITIQTDSVNPQAAADFINALAQEYLDRNDEDRWKAYQTTGSWLTKAQQELKAKLENSELQLAEFAKNRGLLFTGGSQNVSEEKLKQLQIALLTASTDRITKQAAYEASLSKTDSEALPSVLDSGPMSTYQVKMAELKRQLAELSTTLTPAHYKIQQVEAQIEELEKQAARERTNIINRIRIDYEAAVKRENQLRREFELQSELLANQSNDTIQYNILLREVETNRKLYEATLAQGKEASIASAMHTSGARLVDYARVPKTPVRPDLPLNLALGLFGGIFCGAGFVIVRARSDVRIQSPAVLENLLSLRELAVIPAAATDSALPARLQAQGSSTILGKVNGFLATLRKTSSDSGQLALVTLHHKNSMMAESFRSSATSLLYSTPGGDGPRVFIVTSPSPQEGKSTVVSNLAIALAETGQRVLLIDADLRLPRLHTLFDVPNTFGLTDVLYERKPIQEYPDESLVRLTAVPELYILPAGPARTTVSRLLHSARMKELIQRFRDTYDTVLIDTPPVLSVPDARIVARRSDAVILVVRAHQTQQDAAIAAARCFLDDGATILGTILNGWNPNVSTYGPYYGPYHFYAGYHSSAYRSFS
jgi:capsular exopolysaccharide synthesis family protein